MPLVISCSNNIRHRLTFYFICGSLLPHFSEIYKFSESKLNTSDQFLLLANRISNPRTSTTNPIKRSNTQNRSVPVPAVAINNWNECYQTAQWASNNADRSVER